MDALLPVSLHTLLLFLPAGLALNVSPGPNMLYVLASGLRGGGREGVAAAVGINIGAAVHVMLAVLGLTALLTALPMALDVVRILGAGYLLWLGWKAWSGPSPIAAALDGPLATDKRNGRSFARILRDGMVTCVLNPKVGIFFMAFLPQFVERGPNAASASAQILFLGAVFLVTSFLVLMPVALGGGAVSRVLRRRRWAPGFLTKASGTIFIALAMRLLWKAARPAQ